MHLNEPERKRNDATLSVVYNFGQKNRIYLAFYRAEGFISGVFSCCPSSNACVVFRIALVNGLKTHAMATPLAPALPSRHNLDMVSLFRWDMEQICTSGPQQYLCVLMHKHETFYRCSQVHSWRSALYMAIKEWRFTLKRTCTRKDAHIKRSWTHSAHILIYCHDIDQ